nr:hypothetical protein [Tanacetum cinerariifolium]
MSLGTDNVAMSDVSGLLEANGRKENRKRFCSTVERTCNVSERALGSNFKDSIDQTDLANFDNYFVDPTPKMFNDEHALDYSFSPRFDVYPDDFLEIESDADNFYDDPFDSKGEKIKEIFSRDDELPSPDNEDKVFNLGILIHEKLVTIITRVVQEKKLAISYASLVFEDFDPLFYEPIVFKDVPQSMRLVLFSSENEEKVFQTRDIHF